MTVSVRVYESVDHAEPGERFYAETANEARNKACAWIEAERKRLADIGLRREEAAQGRRKTVPHEMDAR